MKNQLKQLACTFFSLYCIMLTTYSFSQDEIDVVDPYEMKVSRSKNADTFYFSQNAKAAVQAKQKLDTLRTYDVFLEERPTPFGTAYMCNGNEVTKQKFFEYKKFWNASGACTPCMLYTYNDKNQLKYVAYQYEDCLCGSYTEYYPEGAKKTEGQFKQNTTGSWQNIRSKNICNIREGVWTYYYETGATEKTETYVDGKLKETVNILVSSQAETKIKKTESSERGTEPTINKKGIFQRAKEKNSTSEK